MKDRRRSTGIAETSPPVEAPRKRRKRAYTPNHLIWETFTLVMYYVPAVVGVLLVLVFLVQFPMEPKADPSFTPTGIAPEWYFLAMFQVLKKMPLLPAVSLIGAYLMAVMFLPFIDFSRVKSGQSPLLKIIGWLNIVVIIYFTAWGGHWLENYIYPLLKIKMDGH